MPLFGCHYAAVGIVSGCGDAVSGQWEGGLRRIDGGERGRSNGNFTRSLPSPVRHQQALFISSEETELAGGDATPAGRTGDMRRFVRWRKSFEGWRKITTIARIGLWGGKVLDARRRSRDRMPRKSRSGGGAGSRAAMTTATGGTRPTVDRPSQVGSVASVGVTARAWYTGLDEQYRVRI